MNGVTRIQLVKPLTGYLSVKDGTVFPITKTQSDVKNFSKRKIDSSKTCILTGDDANKKILSHLFNVNIANGEFNPSLKVEVLVLRDDEVVMDNAYMQLLSVNRVDGSEGTAEQDIEFEVVIFSIGYDLFSNVKNLYVTDLGFDYLNHRFTRPNILATAGNTWEDGYKYHLMYKGGSNLYDLQDFRPGIFFKTYVDRIVEQAGFTYEWEDMSATTFERLFVPYNGKRPSVSRQDLDEKMAMAQYTATTIFTATTPSNSIQGYGATGQLQLTPNIEITDPGNNLSGGTYTPSNANAYTQPYTIRIEIEYDLVLSSSTQAWVVPFSSSNGNQGSSASDGFKFTSKFRVKGANPSFPSPTSFSYNSMDYTRTNADGALPSGSTTVATFNGTVTLDSPLNYSQIYQGFQTFFEYNHSKGHPLLAFRQTNVANGPLATVSSHYVIKSYKLTYEPKLEFLPYSGTVIMNNYVPQKVKQEDMLNTWINLYNIYIQPDPSNQTHLIVKTRDKFYDEGAEQNWTDIFRIDQENTITFLSEVQNKKLITKFKDDDKDVSTSLYKTATNESFGQNEFTFDSEFAVGEQIIEIAPSSTAMIKNFANDVVPAINTDSPDNQWRLLLDNDWIPCVGDGWRFRELTNADIMTFNTYPSLHHWNDPYLPDEDIYFGLCDYYFYSNYTLTNNNSFNLYWRRTVNQWNKGKKLEGWFDLDATTYAKTKLSDKIFIEDAWWNVLEIKDFDVNSNNLTKVTLISIDDEIQLSKFRVRNPRFPGVGNWSVATPVRALADKEIAIKNTFLDGFGNVSQGVGNVFSGSKNLALGDNSTIGATKSLIIGDNGQIESSAMILGDNNKVEAGLKNVFIVGDGVTGDTSNTIYTTNIQTGTINGIDIAEFTAATSGNFCLSGITTDTISGCTFPTIIDMGYGGAQQIVIANDASFADSTVALFASELYLSSLVPGAGTVNIDAAKTINVGNPFSTTNNVNIYAPNGLSVEGDSFFNNEITLGLIGTGTSIVGLGIDSNGIIVSAETSSNDFCGIGLITDTISACTTAVTITAAANVQGAVTATKSFTDTSDVSLVASGIIPGINLRSGTSGSMSILTNYFANDSTSFITGTGSNIPNSGARIHIDHVFGNVGFGNSSPAQRVDVTGNVKANSFVIANTPVLDNAATKLLSRNTSTGFVEEFALSALTQSNTFCSSGITTSMISGCSSIVDVASNLEMGANKTIVGELNAGTGINFSNGGNNTGTWNQTDGGDFDSTLTLDGDSSIVTLSSNDSNQGNNALVGLNANTGIAALAVNMGNADATSVSMDATGSNPLVTISSYQDVGGDTSTIQVGHNFISSISDRVQMFAGANGIRINPGSNGYSLPSTGGTAGQVLTLTVTGSTATTAWVTPEVGVQKLTLNVSWSAGTNTVTHNLGGYVQAAYYEAGTKIVYPNEINYVDGNTISVNVSTATSGRIIIIG